MAKGYTCDVCGDFVGKVANQGTRIVWEEFPNLFVEVRVSKPSYRDMPDICLPCFKVALNGFVREANDAE